MEDKAAPLARPPPGSAAAARIDPLDGPTAQERKVLQLIGEGLTSTVSHPAGVLRAVRRPAQ
jgi:hypothetical protein